MLSLASGDRSEYFFLDEDGLVQAVDLHTGECRALESKTLETSIDKASHTLVKTKDKQLAYVPNRISAKDFEEITGTRRSLPYSPLLADEICTRVAEGLTLAEVARTPGYPNYATLARWRRLHPEFNEMYALARKDRAEIYFARLIEQAETARADRDEVALARLRADIYKFAAKVCAPDEYVEKTQIDAKVAVGTFTIETGIRRVQDPGFNKDETLALSQQEATTNISGVLDNDE